MILFLAHAKGIRLLLTHLFDLLLDGWRVDYRLSAERASVVAKDPALQAWVMEDMAFIALQVDDLFSDNELRKANGAAQRLLTHPQHVLLLLFDFYGLVAVKLLCGVPWRALLRSENDISADLFDWRLEGAEVLDDLGLVSCNAYRASMRVLARALEYGF